jgi:Ca2+-binding EF-hand superfamily protein
MSSKNNKEHVPVRFVTCHYTGLTVNTADMESTPKSQKAQRSTALQNSSEINSVDQLTVENLATLKRAFELHDDREVHIDNLQVVLHSLGVVPSGPELSKMKEELLVHADSNGTIHFQKVLATIGMRLDDGCFIYFIFN